jgi:GNAT superfamily N-acetyltransferase
MGVDSMPFRLEPATERHVPVILRFIKELAEYEKLAHEVVATEGGLREALFGANPAAEAVVAYGSDEPIGFALYFRTFSTFLGRPGLYLEDLYVTPSWRGRGAGRRLLAYVAGVAVDRGYGRLEWSVLDWNELALAVYRKIGARPMNEWTMQRLTGDALRELAASAASAPD